LLSKQIREDWSPEQISGRLLLEYGRTISHETIYRYIYSDRAAGGDLHRHLRCQKKHRKRYGCRDRRGRIPNQRSIDERPCEVDNRSRLGDWEGDTVIGRRHQGALVTVVERKSLFTVIGAVPSKTSAAVTDAIVQGLRPHADKVLTLTCDNGREFAGHEEVAAALDVDVFFAHPYSSWERGTNENTNGLVRQYFPRNRNLREVTREEVESAAARLNNRPRKKLGYRTPREVFYGVTEMLAVALGA
jgi:IS30 family transposase